MQIYIEYCNDMIPSKKLFFIIPSSGPGTDMMIKGRDFGNFGRNSKGACHYAKVTGQRSVGRPEENRMAFSD